MVGTSKILTVSYGTFSCTLEGFDDPFSAMRSIAEYFRDLAAEDRYFGAEPPQPDAEMLHRIAQAEVHKRITAQVGETGVMLRQEDEAEEQPAAEPAESRKQRKLREKAEMKAAAKARVMADEPKAEVISPRPAAPEPESIAAKMLRIRAAVARSAAADSYAEDHEAEPSYALRPITAAFADVRHEDDEARVEADFAEAEVEAREVEHAPEAADDSAFDDEPAAADFAARFGEVTDPEPVAEPEPEEAPRLVRARVIKMKKADFDRAVQPDAEIAEAGAEDDSAADMIRRALSDERFAPEADEDEDNAPVEDEAAPAFADDEDNAEVEEAPAVEEEAPAFAEVEDEDDEQADFEEPSHPFAEAGEVTVEDEDEFEAEDEAPALDVFAEDEAMAEEAEEAAGEIAEEEEAEAALADDAEDDEDASLFAAADDFEDDDEDDETDATLDAVSRALAANAADEDEEDDDAGLFADADDEPAAEDGEDDNLFGEDSVSTLSDEDEAELMEELAEVEREVAETRRARDGKSVLEAHRSAESSVTRILKETESQLDDTEASRRRATIAHLKAAVAATRADREDGEAGASEEEDIGRYRDDLDRVVRPRRPGDGRVMSKPRRLAPLMLVSEQRVDIPPQSAPEPQGDVRPRRITAGNLALMDDAEDEIGQIADTEETGMIADSTSFAEYAEKMGATELPDLLEAAAAYSAYVEGRPSFSRPQLMKQVAAYAGGSFTREEGLRSFGTLLRSGKIQKLKRGQFTIAKSSRFRPDNV